ncbi:MAG: hypothetical protein ACE5H4_02715 [Candidatus Thorarchaeota archaeon]
MSTHPEETPWYFYCVVATQASTQTGYKPVLEARKNAPDGAGAFYTWAKIASYDGEDGDFGWKHVDIARTIGGQITVWINGTLVIQVVDTDIDTSEYFVFMAGNDRGHRQRGCGQRANCSWSASGATGAWNLRAGRHCRDRSLDS